MFLLSFARIIKFSFQDIGRNIWLSIVTITILVLALFSINMLLTVNFIINTAIDYTKEKIDINLDIKPEANEENILALKARITNLREVKEVKYISKAQALEEFNINYRDKPEVLEALREVGKNPLSPSLVIKARNINDYDALINELNKIEDEIIEARDFDDHKTLLNKINGISKKVNKIGIFVSSIFVLVTLLVVFNAIKVAIYTHRREIGIMKLVGASNWFVRMPFLISGIIYALVGTAIIIAVFYPSLTLMQPFLESFFAGYKIDVVGYFNHNFIIIFGSQFLGAALINILASFTALRKYSKV